MPCSTLYVCNGLTKLRGLRMTLSLSTLCCCSNINTPKSIEIDMRMKRNAAITELPAQLMTCQQFKSTFLKPLIGSLGFRKLRGHLGALAVLYISFADFACDRSANWEDDQLYSRTLAAFAQMRCHVAKRCTASLASQCRLLGADEVCRRENLRLVSVATYLAIGEVQQCCGNVALALRF